MAEENKPNTPDSPAPAAPETPAAASEAAATPPAAAKPPAAAPKPPPPKPPPAPTVMVTTPWEDDLTKELTQEFGPRILEFCSYLGQNFLVAQPEAIVDLVAYLKDECAFDYLADVTALHYPKNEKPFEVIYVLYSFARNQRIRIKIKLAEAEKPRSVTGVHVGADWLEREVFDMFGIEFAGHPNLKRILMPDEWNGYPLRKDYGILQQDGAWVQENLGIESGQ